MAGRPRQPLRLRDAALAVPVRLLPRRGRHARLARLQPDATPAQTQLTDIQLVGSYALQPTWADGHHTGFYTFQRLREECPCPEDTARRAPALPAHGEAHALG